LELLLGLVLLWLLATKLLYAMLLKGIEASAD
jgi:hypothetical protein